MEEQKKVIEEVTDNIKDYINTCYEIRVLQASEKISKVTSEIIANFITGFIIALTMVFLSLAGSYYLSFTVFENAYSGFLIVGGLYLMIGVISIVFRKKIFEAPFRNLIIRAMFRDEPLSSIG